MIHQQLNESKPWQISSTYDCTCTHFHKGKRLYNKNNEKLLSVTIDAYHNFKCYLENILKKVSETVQPWDRNVQGLQEIVTSKNNQPFPCLTK